MVIVNNCCGCCSLKTGAIIIGIIGIVNAILTFLILFVQYLFWGNVVEHFAYVIAISSIIITTMLVVSILLISGAIKKKQWCVMPWIVLDIISSAMLSVSIMYISVEDYIENEILAGTTSLIVGLIILTIKIYLWVVVVSFYQFLREEEDK